MRTFDIIHILMQTCCMPLTGIEFAIGSAIVIGLPLAIIFLNRWRRGAGWWLLAGLVGFVVIGNASEKLTTGTSPLF